MSRSRDVEMSGQMNRQDRQQKRPLGQHSKTAGAKEIKVPYLFDERSDTDLPRLRFMLRAPHFQTRSTAGSSGSPSNTQQQRQTNN